jgi:hypothetical protein
MRNGPELAAWDIYCSSAAAARAVQEPLTREASLDNGQVVTVQGGGETREERHRLGDYFRAIRVEPSVADTPNVLRVVFERHAHAGRYWRDLMVRILHSVEGLGQDVKVEFAYRIDEPGVAPPDRAVAG